MYLNYTSLIVYAPYIIIQKYNEILQPYKWWAYSDVLQEPHADHYSQTSFFSVPFLRSFT